MPAPVRVEEQAPQAGGMSPEQAADWAALNAAASEQEAADMQAEQAALPAAPDPAEEWAQLPALFGGVLAMAIPELKAVYTEDACRAWGSAMVPVAEKYGWDASDLLGRWGPEIGLICASLPLAMATVGAIKAKRDKLALTDAKRRADGAAHFHGTRQGAGLAPLEPGDQPAPASPGQGLTFGGVGAGA